MISPRHPRDLLTSVASLCLLVGACTVRTPPVGPLTPGTDRYLPARPVSEAVGRASGPVQRFDPAPGPPARWWTRFGAPALDAAEAEALAHNVDLAAAQASLRQARELYLAQRASLFPAAQAAVSASRSKNSDTIASPLSSNAQTYSLFSGQLTVAYTPDVFGGLGLQTAGVRAQRDVQQELARATYLSLTSNVAAVMVQIASLNSQLAATDAMIAASRRSLEITRRMQALGELSGADPVAADAALQAAEAQAPLLRRQLAVLTDMLSVLTGRPPSETPTPTLGLADLTLPPELPLSLPSDLLRQRPDVRAAEASLRVAAAQAGVAAAARAPSFSLGANAGGTASRLGSLLSSPNTLWTLGVGVTAPVFDAGALRHRKLAADAALDQAKLQYRSTVLAALQSTADVLQAISADADAAGHAAQAEAAARRLRDIALAQEARGQTGALTALAAEVSWRQSELGLIQTRSARMADTVALYQALGGDWRTRADAMEGARHDAGR